ncbi:MAG: phosphoglycerate kinase [Acidobacteriota bacterium]
MIKSIKDIVISGKRVFLRVDFNVPIDEKKMITDDTRIRESIPTIDYLLNNQVKIIVGSHLGRPEGIFKDEFSLKPVFNRLKEIYGDKIKFVPDVIGIKVDEEKAKLKNGEILLLENLRFYKQETDNDEDFSRDLSKNIDIYVNDAFSASHRAHASIVGIPKFVSELAIGFLMEKEISNLSKAIVSPEKPLVTILGGAKIKDKIPVLKNLINFSDSIIIGGAMAYSFLKFKGEEVGKSIVEEDQFGNISKILELVRKRGIKFLLPIDHIVAKGIDDNEIIETKTPIPEGYMGFDIGDETLKNFSEEIKQGKTIIWNGPMGVFEKDIFSRGTTEIAKAIAFSTAFSIVGGGDTVSAISKARVAEKISHVSTGGGASLEFLSGIELPGIKVLKEKQ